MMHKSKGNMYEFIDYTWNDIRGRCFHKCKYCYMLVYPQKELRFVESELKTDLGKDNFIFVGNTCDMFAKDIPEEWILKTLEHCRKFDNKYLFQSKNPDRILNFLQYLPEKCVIGTTIETNRYYEEMGDAPCPKSRAIAIAELGLYRESIITIEPIMDFDLSELIDLIQIAKPKWINIGADSKNHNLTEPDKEKLLLLIQELNKIIEIKKKSNLERLLQ